MGQAKERDALFDNARAVLIFLVVESHLISSYLTGNVLIREIYYAINMVIMPAFVFITGYFSKNVEKGRDGAFKNFLMPYLVFNTLYALMDFAVEGKIGQFLDGYQLFYPRHGMWFLLACFIWKLLAKDLAKIRASVSVCFAIGLLIPVLPKLNTLMSIGRVLGLLPFFVGGLLCRTEWIEKIRRIPFWAGGIVFVLGCLISGLIGWEPWMPYENLYLKESYENDRKREQLLFRLLIYLLATVMTLALLVWTTKKKCILTQIGQNTLTVYVFHLYLIYFIKKYEPLADNLTVYLCVSFPTAVAMVWLLSRPPIRRAYDYLMGGINKACFKS